MITLTSKSNKCWWCGDIANSREHKHKKSDIVTVFGKQFQSEVIIQGEERDKIVQGPNSDLLKFDKVFCNNCNNNRSKPFDLAYSKFINYIDNNKELLIKKKAIDFRDIFSSNALEEKQNVLRYYVKHICSRLASNNISIDKSLIDFLNKTDKLNFLYLKFEIRMDLVVWIEKLKERTSYDLGNLYLGSLFYKTVADNAAEIETVYSSYTYRWFRMYFFYSHKVNDESYPGYSQYNDNLLLPIEVLYLIHPDKYKTLTDEEILEELKTNSAGCRDCEMDNYYLKTNPFAK